VLQEKLTAAGFHVSFVCLVECLASVASAAPERFLLIDFGTASDQYSQSRVATKNCHWAIPGIEAARP
jgi:hypothetical protein